MSDLNMNVNPSMLEDITCEKCGNFTFMSVYLLKKVPALLSPTGKVGIFPMPAFACNACGNINNGMIPRVNEDALKEAATNVPAAAGEEAPTRPKLVLS